MGRSADPREAGRCRRTVAAANRWRGAALVSVLLLAACAVGGWLPAVGLIRLSLSGIRHDARSAGALGPAIEDLTRCLGDSPVPGLVINSLWFGLLVALGILVLGSIVGVGLTGESHGFQLPRPLMSWAGSIPPLVLGAGVLSLPWLAGLAGRSVSDSQHWPQLARGAERLAFLLDIDRNPWILMTLAVGIDLVPSFLRAFAPGGRLGRSRERLNSAIESAVLAGDSRGRARRLADPGWGRRLLGKLLIVWALAATNVTPALLFARWSDQRTVAPVFSRSLPAARRNDVRRRRWRWERSAS